MSPSSPQIPSLPDPHTQETTINPSRYWFNATLHPPLSLQTPFRPISIPATLIPLLFSLLFLASKSPLVSPRRRDRFDPIAIPEPPPPEPDGEHAPVPRAAPDPSWPSSLALLVRALYIHEILQGRGEGGSRVRGEHLGWYCVGEIGWVLWLGVSSGALPGTSNLLAAAGWMVLALAETCPRIAPVAGLLGLVTVCGSLWRGMRGEMQSGVGLVVLGLVGEGVSGEWVREQGRGLGPPRLGMWIFGASMVSDVVAALRGVIALVRTEGLGMALRAGTRRLLRALATPAAMLMPATTCTILSGCLTSCIGWSYILGTRPVKAPRFTSLAASLGRAGFLSVYILVQSVRLWFGPRQSHWPAGLILRQEWKISTDIVGGLCLVQTGLWVIAVLGWLT